MNQRKRMLEGLEADIREHIERETEDNTARGMTPEEARYAAMRKFGNVTLVKEDTRAVWINRWAEELWQDVRYGLRMLRNAPGFAAVAILTLALGIGANTAIFSLIDAVMLRSLPAEKPSELMLLKWSARNSPEIHGYMSSGDCFTSMRFEASNSTGCSLSQPMFERIRDTKQFAGVAAFANSGPLSLTGHGAATMVTGQLVSGDFFETLGVKAAAGRVFEPADDSANAAPVVVLDFGYWQRAWGGSADAVGKTMALNGTAFTILGVAEQRFNGITPGSDYDVWLPLSGGRRINTEMMWRNREADPTFWWLTVIGRMKPGAVRAQVESVVSSVFRNEALHGSVPVFEGGGITGGPGPRPGGLPPSGGMQIVGPGSRPVLAPGPMSGPAPGPMGGPGGSDGNVMVREAVPMGPAGAAGVNRGARDNRNAGARPPRATPNPEPQHTLSKPDDNPTIMLVNAQTGLTGSRGRYANPLYVLMCAVGIILLIACSNVAGLLLARSAARQREMALRLALGAGRIRIVWQLLTESVLLSVMGGTLGVLFAWWGSHAIVSFVSQNQPRPLAFATGIDSRVLGFTVVISLLTGILFGLAPAFRGVRVDLTPALKEGAGAASGFGQGTARRLSVGNALVVLQVALAIVVLVGAGLLLRTLRNLRSIDIGFDAHNVVVFGVNPTLAGYKPEQIDSFYRDLQGRLDQTPGVRSASYSALPLLSGSLMMTSFHWPGTPEDRSVDADTLAVGPDFFSAMQIPFLRGRAFNSTDFEIAAKQSERVPTPVIVDQTFVKKYLGAEEPIGKRFGEGAASANGTATPGYEIVGVVTNVKYSVLRREINPTMFTPQSGMGASFEVRTAGDPLALVPMIRNTVAQIDPNLPLQNVTTQSQQIDRLLFQERLVARLSGFFGVLALVLACIGLYGLLAYEVSRRTREIGVRMALGARAGDVLRLVVRQGLVLVVSGTVVGVGLAVGVTRYLKAMLYEVHANDPATLIIVAILPLVVALLACFLPARRATSIDPIVALRCE